MDGQHSYLTGPWHYCARCDEKTKIHKMKWQKGKLLCWRCVDRKLIGDREVIIAAVLADGKKELSLASELRHPDLDVDPGDITISGL